MLARSYLGCRRRFHQCSRRCRFTGHPEGPCLGGRLTREGHQGPVLGRHRHHSIHQPELGGIASHAGWILPGDDRSDSDHDPWTPGGPKSSGPLAHEEFEIHNAVGHQHRGCTAGSARCRGVVNYVTTQSETKPPGDLQVVFESTVAHPHSHKLSARVRPRSTCRPSQGFGHDGTLQALPLEP